MGKIRVKNMEEFAARSGISRPTVSKYFNDPTSVRTTTRARIEEALERFDYRPNIYAVNQNRALTKNVGIVVPYIADPFFSEIARRLEQRCVEEGYRPTLYSAHGNAAQEVDILEGLRAMKPAGVLMAPLGRQSDKRAIETFCDHVPTILFDSNLEGIGAAFVGSDNASFVSQTTDYLVRTGAPPSFFEMRTPANPNANKRRRAYIKVMEQQNLEPHIVQIEGEGWAFEEIGHRGALEALDRNAFPTRTVLCSNDRLAIGFLSACYARGITVGRAADCEMRMASNDDHPFSRFTCPPLTTAAHDYDSVAGRSMQMLLDLIERGGRFPERTETLFPARLILRESA